MNELIQSRAKSYQDETYVKITSKTLVHNIEDNTVNCKQKQVKILNNKPALYQY